MQRRNRPSGTASLNECSGKTADRPFAPKVDGCDVDPPVAQFPGDHFPRALRRCHPPNPFDRLLAVQPQRSLQLQDRCIRSPRPSRGRSGPLNSDAQSRPANTTL